MTFGLVCQVAPVNLGMRSHVIAEDVGAHVSAAEIARSEEVRNRVGTRLILGLFFCVANEYIDRNFGLIVDEFHALVNS